MNKEKGHIIILAFPDTFVKMSDEWICKLLPWLGLGGKGYIKAGHAALVLVHGTTGDLHYFDFGRYVTPKGRGRVRSAQTDAELKIPIKAEFDTRHRIKNLSEVLLWLEAHPDRTHGEGRMIASVCGSINYQKAFEFATSLQRAGTLPYGAFQKGSNCARFVTDTLLASQPTKKVQFHLKRMKRFTPSAIGNVVFGASKRELLKVENGVISNYQGSALKENLVNYFHQRKTTTLISSPIEAQQECYILEGTGSNAYFQIERSGIAQNLYEITHRNDAFEVTYQGLYFSEELDWNSPFQFTYDSHCAFCHILQGDRKICLGLVLPFTPSSSWRRERSA